MFASARTAYHEATPLDQIAASPDSMLTMLRLGYGAASAWLMFAGADSLSPALDLKAWSSIDFASLRGIAEALLAGPITGPALLIGAVALFFAAGKSIARIVGLGVVATLLALHAEGATAGDFATFFENFGLRLASAASAFLNAQI